MATVISTAKRAERACPDHKSAEAVTRYADMFSAMGTEARLRIVQLLLTAHPEGLVVGEIQEELEIPGSTLSHHL
ncbi:MAG TPA: helix-turn-helix domain-containing protein, partial [Candidatus Acidoferrales bacterium]|nr:helix-turn-helix domain-containing protein [Candidatus Acidoferrales bacterium]